MMSRWHNFETIAARLGCATGLGLGHLLSGRFTRSAKTNQALPIAAVTGGSLSTKRYPSAIQDSGSESVNR
jgi:hypothetical protein